MVQFDPVLQIAPSTIDDLCPTFGFHLLACGGVCVDSDFDVGGLLPYPFALHFDSLLAVSDMVMKDTRQTQAIGLGGIRVKDDTSVLQMLCGPKVSTQPCEWLRCQVIVWQTSSGAISSTAAYLGDHAEQGHTIVPTPQAFWDPQQGP